MLNGIISSTISINKTSNTPFPFVEGVVALEKGPLRIISHGGIDGLHSPTMLQLRNVKDPSFVVPLVRWSNLITNSNSDPFGEGVTLLHSAGQTKLVQLSFQAHKGWVWNLDELLAGKASYESATQINYEGEGWGLTTVTDDLTIQGINYNGQALMSDGTNRLTIRDIVGDQFKTVAILPVLDEKNERLAGINSLAYLGHGRVLANIWSMQKNGDDHNNHPYLLLIDLKTSPTAKVIAKINLPQLIVEMYQRPNQDLLDGISHYPETNKQSEFLSTTYAARSSVTNGIVIRDDGSIEVYGKNWDRAFILKNVFQCVS